jgi:hypothetical protein
MTTRAGWKLQRDDIDRRVMKVAWAIVALTLLIAGSSLGQWVQSQHPASDDTLSVPVIAIPVPTPCQAPEGRLYLLALEPC